jgi:hypothetical protein
MSASSPLPPARSVARRPRDAGRSSAAHNQGGRVGMLQPTDGQGRRSRLSSRGGCFSRHPRATPSPAEPTQRPLSELPPNQAATLGRADGRGSVDARRAWPLHHNSEAASLLRVSPRLVGRLTAEGRRPLSPTGRSGEATQVYRRAQFEVIARSMEESDRLWRRPARVVYGVSSSLTEERCVGGVPLSLLNRITVGARPRFGIHPPPRL